MSGLWDVSGHSLILRPHPGQIRAWHSKRRFVFMLAGTQSGKTSWGPFLLHKQIQESGPGDYLAVTSTFPLLKLKMLPEFLRLFQHTLHLGEWHASDRVFSFHDGQTRVIFGSAVNSESLESATAKAAWLDEVGQDQFRLESWEAILRRLSLYQGRVFAGTTVYNLGWLKQQVYDRWRAGDKDYDIIQFESTANPVFPLAEYERAKRALPTWKFRMMYGGEFDRPAGLIYSDFLVDKYREDGGHLVHPFDIPSEWPRHVGIDFGAVNTALVWLAQDPKSQVYYAYRESLEGNKTTKQHVQDALAIARGVNVRTWHGGAKSEVQQRLDWQSAGIYVQEPRVADVEAGIDRVIEFGKTFRLYIFDTLSRLRDEMGTYSRELDESGQSIDKIKDKETFHTLDALRYCVLGIAHTGIPFGWIKLSQEARA